LTTPFLVFNFVKFYVFFAIRDYLLVD